MTQPTKLVSYGELLFKGSIDKKELEQRVAPPLLNTINKQIINFCNEPPSDEFYCLSWAIKKGFFFSCPQNSKIKTLNFICPFPECHESIMCHYEENDLIILWRCPSCKLTGALRNDTRKPSLFVRVIQAIKRAWSAAKKFILVD